MAKRSLQKNRAGMTDVGERVRENRKKQGMTREQLAESCGLAVQSVVKIESGTRDFRISTLYALVRGLGLSADYLLGLSDFDDEENISTLYSMLDCKGKRFIKNMLQAYLEACPHK